MTAEEIAETLINGNITDARNEILRRKKSDIAVLTLDVLEELVLAGVELSDAHNRLRRCLAGGR